MRFGKQIFLGVLIGLAVCVWLTFTMPRMRADAPPVPTPIVATPSVPTPTPVNPVVAGLASIKILLYDVRITVDDPIEDLVYGEIKDGGNTWAGFTTKKLLAKYPDCKAGALGMLTRTKAKATPTPKPTATPSPHPRNDATGTPFPTKSPTNLPFTKTINGYTYSYRPSYWNCADDQSGNDALAAARAALKNASLPTLTN
jgi:hypothetical protein